MIAQREDSQSCSDSAWTDSVARGKMIAVASTATSLSRHMDCSFFKKYQQVLLILLGSLIRLVSRKNVLDFFFTVLPRFLTIVENGHVKESCTLPFFMKELSRRTIMN